LEDGATSDNSAQANFGEFLFHALGEISLRAMRQTPPGGIMNVVANPLEKNAGWQGGASCCVVGG
jgi:hypothetical protein